MNGSRQVALAATGPASLGAGQQVVAEGGNAVDAAIAAAITTMSSEPGIVSAGGAAFVAIWPVSGEPVVVDGNVVMPGRGLGREAFGGGVREVVTDYGGGVTLYAGHGSVAVPGALAACEVAMQRYGSRPWASVVEPAAAVCRDGYPVGGAAARYLGFVGDSLFGVDAGARAVTRHEDGTPYVAGDLARNPLLADVLDRVARDGAEVLTTGEIGRALVDDMRAHGGLVTEADLTAYEVVVREPVRRTLGGWDVAVNPPPSVGGPMLAVMLTELERASRSHPIGGKGTGYAGDRAAGDSPTWDDILRIQRAVLGYRRDVHDLSRDLDRDGWAVLEAVDRHGLAGLPTSSSTAHVSAVDSDGLACAVTMSAGYGAGVTIPGTGLLLNNALGEPELNRLGLHSLTPGTRLASNMAPTVARSGDGGVLAIGSPGADRITTALMQVLAQLCCHGVDLDTAIAAPRAHVRFDDAGEPVVEHEADPAITAAVEKLGWRGHDHGELSMYFGGVGAALREGDGAPTGGGAPTRDGEHTAYGPGVLRAAGDPRREAAVGVSSAGVP
ncbi:gamma-glutamyltranspeptidase/glutathione hydrolase [Knoellia remsis]|uniref:Gamma-glutamyltranspeptidase/glutathione hydrolase n=1 Tax=Knoellia remsis TaxID=407159 RepID=A0A2T0U3P0_9MICO|nr:gamma-glutamyltransferase [Knoellia remsis]PRY52532.1 gamma-glutamyltranspeptidase/glutathione hydrolase [Knoellia remsis]